MFEHSRPLKFKTLLFATTQQSLMHRTFFFMIATLVSLLTGCAGASQQASSPERIEQQPQATSPMLPEGAHYTNQSWKSLIDESCQAYFDGCNQCRRALGATAVACTRKACQTYQKPYCLDESASAEPAAKRWVSYRCQDGRALRVYFGEYRTAALALTLPADKIMLEDSLLPAPIALEQGISASGTRYQGDDADFWSKGSSAHYAPPGHAAMPCEQTANGSFGER